MVSTIAERFSSWTAAVRSRLTRKRATDSQNLVEGTPSQSSRAPSGGYTELMGGSVPCPSCSGSGRIPMELESTLVALIPVNDERLKPKKTWLYILLWVLICAIIGGTVIFILMPRTVTLSSWRTPIEEVDVFEQDTKTRSYIDFYFPNKVNISSGNYLPVSVVNITSTIISKFQPYSSDVVGHGLNESLLQQPLTLYRAQRELYFNNTVQLTGAVSEYCQGVYSRLTSLFVSLQFDVAVTLRYYYGHEEQITLSMVQQVCCIPSGNCTNF